MPARTRSNDLRPANVSLHHQWSKSFQRCDKRRYLVSPVAQIAPRAPGWKRSLDAQRERGEMWLLRCDEPLETDGHIAQAESGLIAARINERHLQLHIEGVGEPKVQR